MSLSNDYTLQPPTIGTWVDLDTLGTATNVNALSTALSYSKDGSLLLQADGAATEVQGVGRADLALGDRIYHFRFSYERADVQATTTSVANLYIAAFLKQAVDTQDTGPWMMAGVEFLSTSEVLKTVEGYAFSGALGAAPSGPMLGASLSLVGDTVDVIFERNGTTTKAWVGIGEQTPMYMGSSVQADHGSDTEVLCGVFIRSETSAQATNVRFRGFATSTLGDGLPFR